MFYIVELVIKCDEKVKAKLEAIMTQWASVEFEINKRPIYDGKKNPDIWNLWGIFEESEKNNAYSIPLIVDNNGGLPLDIWIKPTDDISYLFDD